MGVPRWDGNRGRKRGGPAAATGDSEARPLFGVDRAIGPADPVNLCASHGPAVRMPGQTRCPQSRAVESRAGRGRHRLASGGLAGLRPESRAESHADYGDGVIDDEYGFGQATLDSTLFEAAADSVQ